MKLMIRPVLFVWVCFMLLSCEQLKKLSEVDFTADFSETYQVNLNQNESDINIEKTFDITEDEEVEKYKEKLEDIELDSVMISVKNINVMDDVFLDGYLKYSDIGQMQGIEFANISNLNITELSSSGNKRKLSIKTEEISKMTAILENDNKIKIYLSGLSSIVPVDFELTVYFYTTVTAQALD